MTYHFRKLAAYVGGHGRLAHVVPIAGYVALCGATPGRRSAGWSTHDEPAATCPKCLRKHVNHVDYLRRCAEGEGGRAVLAIEGYANPETARYFAQEAAHYAGLILAGGR